jgi:hypothetical protein
MAPDIVIRAGIFRAFINTVLSVRSVVIMIEKELEKTPIQELREP